jgi:hypothetical protein
MTPACPIVAVSTVAPLCMTATRGHHAGMREIDLRDLLPDVVQHHAALDFGERWAPVEMTRVSPH